MSTFPTINHLDDLLPQIRGNVQIRVKQEPCGKTVVCYMLQDEDTFDGLNRGFERECRGITFHENGKVASRTLHKFFNVGEREDTQPQNIQWSKVARIMDKRDGSMITPVLLDTVFNTEDGGTKTIPWPKCKTKKSFDTKEATLADEVIAKTPGGTAWVSGLLHFGYTPTFEITSPKYPIVLTYEKDELTLLHVRENVSGRYLSEAELIALDSPFPIVENIMEQFFGDGLPQRLVSWDKLKVAAETRDKIEGWIIQFENGDMVKLKTAWYCELHHSVTFTRWRDIARTVVADKSDDLKGAFTLTGRSIEPIVFVENKIKDVIAMQQMLVEAAVAVGKAANMDAKAMALNLKGHELFGQIMRTFRGGEINWMEWYEKNRLDGDWSLEVVGVSE